MVFVEVVLGFFFLRRGTIGGRHMDEFAPGTLMIRAVLVAVKESAGRRAQRAGRTGLRYPHLE